LKEPVKFLSWPVISSQVIWKKGPDGETTETIDPHPATDYPDWIADILMVPGWYTFSP
jgi:hypothetical protein